MCVTSSVIAGIIMLIIQFDVSEFRLTLEVRYSIFKLIHFRLSTYEIVFRYSLQNVCIVYVLEFDV